MSNSSLYVGSYTQVLPHVPNPQGKGIYSFQFDGTSGALVWQGLAARAVNPSFITAHPTGHTIYAVNEVQPGRLSAYRVHPTGPLILRDTVPTQGNTPAHVAVDAAGSAVLAVNYDEGASLMVYALQPNGDLGQGMTF